MGNDSPSMLKATLIGGALFGFLGGLPLVSCLCCLLMAGGGFLAAFLYSKEVAAAGGEFTPGNGAMVGLVSSGFYTVINAIVSFIVQAVMGTDMGAVFEQLEDQGIEVPPEVFDFMTNAGAFTFALIGFAVTLIIAAIFCTLGGLIGGAVFKVQRQVPPAGPPQPGPGTAQ